MTEEEINNGFNSILEKKGLQFSSNLNPLMIFKLGVEFDKSKMYSEEDMK